MSTYEEIRRELDSIRTNFINNIELENLNNSEFELLEQTLSENIGPKSEAGIVYKYNRGVIGIDKDGKEAEINIDNFDSNSGGHSVATLYVGCLLNKECKEKYHSLPILTPFESGKIISDYGIYIIQLEGDSMYVYIPENPTDIQKRVLQEEIDLRSNFKVEYIGDMKKVSGLK